MAVYIPRSKLVFQKQASAMLQTLSGSLRILDNMALCGCLFLSVFSLWLGLKEHQKEATHFGRLLLEMNASSALARGAEPHGWAQVMLTIDEDGFRGKRAGPERTGYDQGVRGAKFGCIN